MKKLTILFSLFSMTAIAQVGVSTTAPQATLDVTAASTTGTSVDGLLIPRVSRLRAQSMTGTPTSTMIYVNDVTNGTATGTTVNVTTAGFYFFNGAIWERLGSGAVNAWNITGNSGTSAATNFVGTTDNVDLPFRRNNTPAGRIGASSVSFGLNAAPNTTGVDNAAFGNNALTSTTTGIQNTAIGSGALNRNTGNASTAVGTQALNMNTIGNNNTAVGFQALMRNTNVSNNTAIGFFALTNNTTGNPNTAVGHQALAANTIGSANTSLGYQSGMSLTNGSRNTAIGHYALAENTGGVDNVAIGNSSLGRNRGSGNVAIGHESMFASATGFNNSTAIGWHALFGNTATGNTAVGHNALQGSTSATGNTAMGASALNNGTGGNNTAMGSSAGFENGSGSNNTFVGFDAGRYNTGAASNNAFFGSQAGHRSTGSSNTAMGAYSLMANAASASNVAIGSNALRTATGSGNVAIGANAGEFETGSNKLYITNSNTTPTTSLVYGEFSPTRIFRTNSTFQIGDPNTTGYVFPVARGTANQVLQTNAAGVLSWVNPSAIAVAETDPKVLSATTTAVPRWNGTSLTDGVIRDDATNVGVGIAPSAGNRLDVNGKTRTTAFQMTTGAANGHILQSDATGNGTWVQNPMVALSLVRATLLANQPLADTGWQKLNFNSESFDTASEFAGGTFTASKTGFYRITAVMHTTDQSNNQYYGIGIYIGGVLYQETIANHHGNGPVMREVTCLAQLNVGNTVEVYVRNHQTGAAVDSFPTKTVFEIQQVR